MNREHRILATVAATLRAAVPAVLSDFELSLIDEISARRAELGDMATISPAEAERLIELVAVMKKHLQDQVADRGRQFAEILGRIGQVRAHSAMIVSLSGLGPLRAAAETALAHQMEQPQ